MKAADDAIIEIRNYCLNCLELTKDDSQTTKALKHIFEITQYKAKEYIED
jgi:hypothetical protein